METFTDGRGYYLNEEELVNQIKEDLAKAEKSLGRKPTALVLGALGRCGKGAVDLFLKAGMPDENITRWDLNETKDRDGKPCGASFCNSKLTFFRSLRGDRQG